jgi:hypothetical protein
MKYYLIPMYHPYWFIHITYYLGWIFGYACLAMLEGASGVKLINGG